VGVFYCFGNSNLKVYNRMKLIKGIEMIETLTLTVTDMKCGGCEANITEKLKAISGIISVAASAKNNEISLEYNNELTDIDTIKATIIATGFGI
jgi:copper chaperone